MGKRRKQDVCLLTTTNRVEDTKLESDILHAESPSTLEAWGLDGNQQAIDEKTGRYIQFISSLSCDPLQIYQNSPVHKSNTPAIASQTEDQEMVYIEEGKRKDSRLLWIGICLAMLTLTVCVIALLKMQGG